MNQLNMDRDVILVPLYRIGILIGSWTLYQNVCWDTVISPKSFHCSIVMHQQLSLVQLLILKIEANGENKLNYIIMTNEHLGIKIVALLANFEL